MSSNNLLLFILPIVAAITYCNGKYVQNPHELMFGNVQMHPSCKDQDYCLEVDDSVYPHDLLEKLVANKKLENLEIGSTGRTEYRFSDHSIVNPCEMNYTDNKPIYQIKDRNQKVRFVVQTDRFKQIIRLEWCKTKGYITKENKMYDLPFDLDLLSSDSLVASCEESYTNYKFLVLSLDGQYLESVMVGEKSIPVCCRCNIKDVFMN